MPTDPQTLHALVAQRYLTLAAKRAELAVWASRLIDPGPRHAGDAGGQGYVDPEVIPWCARLNALPGVCTLQSCSGHAEGDWRTPAQLWLWLDERRAGQFYAAASELSRMPGVEHVGHQFLDGREIVDVRWRPEESPLFVDELERALLAEPVEPAPYGSEVLCPACAQTFCPHAERLHFHHDGCPACAG